MAGNRLELFEEVSYLSRQRNNVWPAHFHFFCWYFLYTFLKINLIPVSITILVAFIVMTLPVYAPKSRIKWGNSSADKKVMLLLRNGQCDS